MYYDGYGYSRFPKKTSVATAKARAEKDVASLKKKGKTIEPVPPMTGRTVATTFWGKAWCENLERYSDYANRLPRGRTYVRSGCVVNLCIESGRVLAKVRGSSMYEIEIEIDAVEKGAWEKIVSTSAGKVGSLVELLSGKLSRDVIDVVTREGTGLFPTPKGIHMECSCPDWATMCKHVAAVLYGVGNRLDARPELLFTLRRVDAADLVGAGAKALVAKSSANALDGDLSAIFGVEIEGAGVPWWTRATPARA